MFKAKGKLIYDPKSEESKFQSWWCKLEVHSSILFYYQYWIRRELGLHLNTPIWKGHITVIRGETPTKPWNWKKHQGEIIDFEYDPRIKMSETYAWVQARSKRLSEIRVELGLTPEPRVPFHITIGNTKNVTPRKVKEAQFKTFPWERTEHLIKL